MKFCIVFLLEYILSQTDTIIIIIRESILQKRGIVYDRYFNFILKVTLDYFRFLSNWHRLTWHNKGSKQLLMRGWSSGEPARVDGVSLAHTAPLSSHLPLSVCQHANRGSLTATHCSTSPVCLCRGPAERSSAESCDSGVSPLRPRALNHSRGACLCHPLHQVRPPQRRDTGVWEVKTQLSAHFWVFWLWTERTWSTRVVKLAAVIGASLSRKHTLKPIFL